MNSPICTACNDSHKMIVLDHYEQECTQMCTGCPLPCQKCRAGGNGPYCTNTPCDCGCHSQNYQYKKYYEMKIKSQLSSKERTSNDDKISIVQFVNDLGGCKFTDLYGLQCLSDAWNDYVYELVQQLVRDKKIKEIRYTLYNSVRIFLLPVEAKLCK